MLSNALIKHLSATDAWEWAYGNAIGDCSMVTVTGRAVTYLEEHPSTGMHGIVNALSNGVYGAYELPASEAGYAVPSMIYYFLAMGIVFYLASVLMGEFARFGGWVLSLDALRSLCGGDCMRGLL